MSWLVPPEWLDETVYILSPALETVNRSKLRGRILAVGDSFKLVPFADVLYFRGLKWWQRRRNKVREIFAGRYLVTTDNEIPGAKSLRTDGESTLQRDPGMLCNGLIRDQAINLAYHFGATEVVLVGFDMDSCLQPEGVNIVVGHTYGRLGKERFVADGHIAV